MRATLDEYPERVLIGELYLPFDRLALYYGADARGAHLPFNFHLITAEWRAEALAKLIKDYEAVLPPGAWPNWVLGNHDQKRIASRLGQTRARLAAMALLTLRGTPTLYYGDEIGMPDGRVPSGRVQDPLARREPGRGRDPERTPMAWDASAHGGFTTGTPWLPVNPDWTRRNVAAMSDDPRSILTLYRQLIALRRERKALQTGPYRGIGFEGGCLVLERGGEGDERIIVALNLVDDPARLALPSPSRVLLSSRLDRECERVEGEIALRPSEGVILLAEDR